MKKGPPPKLQRGLSMAQFVSAVDASQLEKVRELWDQLDTNKKGVISKEDLAEVLYASNVDATEDEMEELMRELDRDGDGLISFKEFAHSVIKKQGAPTYVAPVRSASPRPLATSSEKLKAPRKFSDPTGSFTKPNSGDCSPKTAAARRLEKTASVMNFVQHLSPTQMAEMQKLFNHYDDDKDGKINFATVRTIMREINPDLGKEDMFSLLQLLDSDKDGLISYGEFIEGVVIAFRGTQEKQQNTPQPLPAKGITDLQAQIQMQKQRQQGGQPLQKSIQLQSVAKPSAPPSKQSPQPSKQSPQPQPKKTVQISAPFSLSADDDDFDDDSFSDSDDDEVGAINGAGVGGTEVEHLRRDLAQRDQLIHKQQREIDDLRRKLEELYTDNTKLKKSLQAFIS